MEDNQSFNEWFTNYKLESAAEKAPKYKKTSIVTGTFAALSSLLVVYNILENDVCDALQMTGTTVALVAQTIGFSKNSKNYKDESNAINERKDSPLGYIQSKMSALKYELDRYKTSKTMEDFVVGGFGVATLGYVMDILMDPNYQYVLSTAALASLSAFISFMSFKLSKQYKRDIAFNEEKLVEFSELERLENMAEIDEKQKRLK